MLTFLGRRLLATVALLFFVSLVVFLLVHALPGDLGRSLRTNQPVTHAILERLPVTLELMVAALLVSLLIAIPMGILSAVKRNSGIDLGGTLIALIGFSMPGFWLGLILIYVFALVLRWPAPSGVV